MVNSNIKLVKNFFIKELPEFSFINDSSYSMFWEISFTNTEIDIKISGDAGGFSICLYIEKTEYPLWQYDRSVNAIAKTNDDNILSQLNILKKLINELTNESPT